MKASYSPFEGSPRGGYCFEYRRVVKGTPHAGKEMETTNEGYHKDNEACEFRS